MERIIEDVLLLARQGRDIKETAPVSFRDAVADAWAMVSQDTPDGTLVFADADDQGVTIVAERLRLLQLLENLLRNSVEHGSTGSQQKPGDAADRGGVTVTVGATEDGFYVDDDGPGVPEAEREALFGAGYSTAEDGSGFGLAIVDRITAAHGWSVTVADSADGGARFELTGVEFE